jgi:hypothetical protein
VQKGLLQGWWWPVGPKLVFDQMTARVPEVTDTFRKHNTSYSRIR